jgi:glutamyl-tRNA(Gln) amidotransferase subunit E
MMEWGIPEDTYTYIFKKNLYPLIVRIISELEVKPSFAGSLFGHSLKYVEGHYVSTAEFNFKIVYALIKFLKDKRLDYAVARKMLPVVFQHPKMDFESVLTSIKFKSISHEEIYSHISFLKKKFADIRFSKGEGMEVRWIMGQLRKMAIGNICMKELAEKIKIWE